MWVSKISWSFLTRFLFSRFSCKEPKKCTHFTDQMWNLFEPPSKTSTITPQKATELDSARVFNLENVTIASYHAEPSTLQ